MNKNIIALDGPAGSGKSFIAREIAKQIGFKYFDSGAYYRALTLGILHIYHKENCKEPFNAWLTSQNPSQLINGIEIDCVFTAQDENQILLNGLDVTKEIRSPQVANEIKYIADKLEFRSFVNERIKKLASFNRLVMDGRDIGTEVFPDAIFKFFITANIAVRAERRHNDLIDRGIASEKNKIKTEIEIRDKTDLERSIAPLKQASDAILIDTSQMTKNIVIEYILSKIQRDLL